MWLIVAKFGQNPVTFDIWVIATILVLDDISDDNSSILADHLMTFAPVCLATINQGIKLL